jgi:glutamate--cysteine ligase
VDCQQQQEIAGQFGVQNLPTVILVKEGQPIDGFAGVQTEEQIIATFEKHLPKPEDGLYQQAVELVSAGEYQQLSTSLLQIENEFYSTIRPKRTAASGETPVHALVERGVEYIEVRCVDLNPLLPCGIDEETICFLDTFLLFCLLQDSPPTDAEEYACIPENIDRTVYSGRDPALSLLRGKEEVPLREWGRTLLDEMRPVATLLDSANQTVAYTHVLEVMLDRIHDDGSTPAARLLTEMRENDETYYGMAMRKACEHRDYFQANPPSVETMHKYKELAEKSLQKQADIEAQDSLSFDEFLADYYR